MNSDEQQALSLDKARLSQWLSDNSDMPEMESDQGRSVVDALRSTLKLLDVKVRNFTESKNETAL